ncbi:unnamed protein product, partial [Cylindrotheca closterium]
MPVFKEGDKVTYRTSTAHVGTVLEVKTDGDVLVKWENNDTWQEASNLHIVHNDPLSTPALSFRHKRPRITPPAVESHTNATGAGGSNHNETSNPPVTNISFTAGDSSPHLSSRQLLPEGYMPKVRHALASSSSSSSSSSGALATQLDVSSSSSTGSSSTSLVSSSDSSGSESTAMAPAAGSYVPRRRSEFDSSSSSDDSSDPHSSPAQTATSPDGNDRPENDAEGMGAINDPDLQR